MTVLVAGATGTIGGAVVQQLTREGRDLVALIRTPTVTLAEQTTVTTQHLRGAFKHNRFDTVISCMASRSGAPADAWAVDYEANRELLSLATEFQAKHFVLLSAICVQKPRLEFQRAKLAFEEELRAAPLTHSIVRPTAFFKSLSGQVKRVRDGRPFMVLGDGTQTSCKPISDRDLARYITRCIDDPELHDRILPIGGPGPALTPRDQGEILFRLLKRPPRFRQVPSWVFGAIVGSLGIASRIWPPLSPKAEFARIGRYYATESMLLWDEAAQRYNAEATPEFGADTLEAFYREALEKDEPAEDLGEHAVF